MDKFASTDVTPVVDAYEHALFAQNPRSEYYPGIQAIAFLVNMIPRPIATYIVCNIIGGARFYKTPGIIKKTK